MKRLLQKIRTAGKKEKLFSVVLLLWLIPMTNIIPAKRLLGHYTATPLPKFSAETWFEGSYQEQMEKHTTERTLIRNFFVRVNNQIDFTFYDKASTIGVIVGKEGYLYEEFYIDACQGRDFRGSATLDSSVIKIKAVRDTLKQLDIDLVLVFAMGKGVFYPEYIPERYHPKDRSQTNVAYLTDALEEENIPYMDCNSWFLQMKDTSRYPLCPKTGIHWSKYGQVLVADSLIGFIENMRGIKMPELVIDSIEVSTTPRGIDNDIAKSLNLLFKIPVGELAYPSIHFEQDSSTIKPKMIGIGDSFLEALNSWELLKEIGQNDFFLYYNMQLYSEQLPEPVSIKDLNYQELIENQDVIIIMSTDANFREKVFFDFFDKLYKIYFPEKKNSI